MHDDLKQEGLIVIRSDVPLVRAGYANLIFLLLAVGLVLINQALSDFGIAKVIKGIMLVGFCLLMLKIYTQSVSKILIKDRKALVIVGPLSRTEIWIDDILETKVFGISSSMTIIFKIRRKSSVIPKFYFFVAVSTNYGSYADTRKKLDSLLMQLGCIQ
jgi:hypothetical protein